MHKSTYTHACTSAHSSSDAQLHLKCPLATPQTIRCLHTRQHPATSAQGTPRLRASLRPSFNFNNCHAAHLPHLKFLRTLHAINCFHACPHLPPALLPPAYSQATNFDTNTLATIDQGAPHLQRLDAPPCDFNRHVAQLLAAHLPRLSSLRIGFSNDQEDAAAALVILAGGTVRMTSLVFECMFDHLRVPLTGMGGGGISSNSSSFGPGLRQLQELRGVELPFDRVADLAEGCRQLRVLEAFPVGAWQRAQGVFPELAYLKVGGHDCGGFCAARGHAAMFPLLQHLIVDWTGEGVDPWVKLQLAGLTGLRSLWLRMDCEIWPLGADQWDALAAMPHLRQLACDLRLQDVQLLKRLDGRSLRALDVFSSPARAAGAGPAAGPTGRRLMWGLRWWRLATACQRWRRCAWSTPRSTPRTGRR